MSVLTPPMSSPASLKRSYADTWLDDNLPDLISPISGAATHVAASTQDRSQSPSHAKAPIPTISVASNTPTAAVLAPSAATPEKSNKRTKLTFAEKEAMQIEKQFKEQQKAEEKAKKEAEKEAMQIEKQFKEQQKAEEKAKKEAEKEAMQIEKQFKEQQKAEERAKKEAEKAKKDEEKRAKDAEKEERMNIKKEQAKAKETEKQRKLEEKNKKARSQLRLNAFFVQPSMPNSTPSASPSRDTASPLSSRRSSIAETKEMEKPRERSRSVSVTPQKALKPDYERQFPPFFLQSHTVLAPHSRFSRDGKGLTYAQKKIDEAFGQAGGTNGAFNAYDLLHMSPRSRRRAPRVHAVKDVIARIHGSAANPIDLTESQSRRATQKPTDLLKYTPMKYLKFFEDYRPPYTGTFTKITDRRVMSKLCRRPFSRELPDTNYDYDSEAEWEEPGEGEDLDSEGEEEVGEDEEENDMEGFLDDEHDAVRKRPLLGDLEPTCSGICWEDLENEESKLANLDVLDLSHFKLDILMENPQLPIDPYSTSYWKPNASNTPVNASSQVDGTLMEPPRIPLNPINRQNILLSPSVAVTGVKVSKSSDATGPNKAPKGPKRLIPPELLDEFKRAVDGNELTKLGLVEVLKQQFPKQPKAAIKDTLDTVAERIGPKEGEKKWVLKVVAQS